MSRKTRAFRVFLHQNQNPTVKQAWDAAWKRAQKTFYTQSMRDMEEKLAAAQAEIEALRAEVERLNRYYKNAIDCFANPCERHRKTPPFSEFFERYGGQCLICVVDNNKALQAECEALRKDAERYRWLRLGAHDDSDLDRWEHVGYVCGVSVCTDYGVQQTLYAEDLDAAIDAELAKVGDA